MRFLQNPILLLYFIPTFLITITVHEVAHAYVAWKLGDPTARAMGRVTLNPLRHIDPIGLVMLLIVGFGWAKPVPINPQNFKNEKLGMAISAIAGPISNILMAFLGFIIFRVIFLAAINTGNFGAVVRSSLVFTEIFATLNVWFAALNLLPIPPLDGSRIVNYFLPPRLSYYYTYVERYGFLILMALLWTGILERPLGLFSDAISSLINFILNPIFNFFI